MINLNNIRKSLKHDGTFVLLLLILVGSNVKAQDLEPRYLSPAPVGMNFLLFGYMYSNGNILLDSALPIEGSEAKINTFVGAYVRTISLFGLPGKVDVIVPYSFGKWRGEFYGSDSSVARTGLGDPLIRLSVIIIGGEALDASEFKSYKEGFTLGAAMRVRIPIGQYDNTKLINLGTNRWMFKPSLGMSYKINKWIFELHFKTLFFTTNKEFYNGNQLKQDPLYSGQVHVIYSFKAGFWGALSYGLVAGGRITLNDVYNDNNQLSEKIGAVLIFPLSQNNSLKVGYTSGISARYGTKFDIIGITYQYRWF